MRLTKFKTIVLGVILFYIVSAIGVWFNSAEWYLRFYTILTKASFLGLSYVCLSFAKEKKDILAIILSKIFFWNSLVRFVFEVLLLGCLVGNWFYTFVFILTNVILLYFLMKNKYEV